MGFIKLQLLYGVRIERLVGSLPYPGMIPTPKSVLGETGKSGFPIVALSGRVIQTRKDQEEV